MSGGEWGRRHYDYRFRQYRPADVQLRPGWAHNDYLNALAEWGVVGTALVASAWVLLGLGVLKTWPVVRGTPSDLGGGRNSNKFAFVLGASVGLAAILVHSVVDFNMHIPANAILAITLMALLSSCLRFATERYWVTVEAWGKALASAVVLAGVVYLGQSRLASCERICLAAARRRRAGLLAGAGRVLAEGVRGRPDERRYRLCHWRSLPHAILGGGRELPATGRAGDGVVRAQHQVESVGWIYSNESVGWLWLVPGLAGAV